MTSLIGYLLKEAVKQRRNIVVIIVIVLFCVGYLVEIDLEALKILLNLLFLGFGLLGLLGNIDRCLYLRYLLLGGLLRLRFFRRFLLFGGFGPRN